MSIDLHTIPPLPTVRIHPRNWSHAAWQAGVRTLGLTDHDATGGWRSAAASLPSGMTLVPGAELSCEYQPADDVVIPLHLLGYLFDPDEPRLRARMAAICRDRIGRAERMVELMEADGVPITWTDVEAVAAGGTVGRPHIARALVAAGVVRSVDAAFAGPINSRSRYYVGKADIPVLEAITLVGAAGGVCVFAHPLRRGRQVDDDGVALMAQAGLRGIELFHPDHDEDDRRHLSGLARELDLVTLGPRTITAPTSQPPSRPVPPRRISTSGWWSRPAPGSSPPERDAEVPRGSPRSPGSRGGGPLPWVACCLAVNSSQRSRSCGGLVALLALATPAGAAPVDDAISKLSTDAVYLQPGAEVNGNVIEVDRDKVAAAFGSGVKVAIFAAGVTPERRETRSGRACRRSRPWPCSPATATTPAPPCTAPAWPGLRSGRRSRRTRRT